jgi:hypothetical protein
MMSPAEQYRERAAAMTAKAKVESNPVLRAEFENLSRAYLRLAEQAERNALTDLVYETPAPSRPVAQQQQQQQQNQPAKKPADEEPK